MKLHEIQLTPDVLLEAFDKDQIAKAVETAMESDEYKKLAKRKVDLSTDRQHKQGTFMFGHESARSHGGALRSPSDIHKAYTWNVYANGRLVHGASVKNNVASPALTTNDLAENYRRQFQRILDILDTEDTRVNRSTFIANPPVRQYDKTDDKISGFKEGAPFSITNLNIETLDGAPKEATLIKIDSCKSLKTLEHCPKLVTPANWNVSREGNVKLKNLPNLTSLEGIPKQVGKLELYSCPKLTSLKGVDIADEVIIDTCRGISTLEGIGRDYLKVAQSIRINPKAIKSHVLGLMLIEGLKHLFSELYTNKNPTWFLLAYAVIENKDIHPKERAIELQSMLIDHDLDGYAQL